MSSPQAQAFNQMVRDYRDAALGGDQMPTIEDIRAGAESMLELVGVMPEGVSTTTATVVGCDALWFDAQGGSVDHVILHFHGGGYVMNSIRSHSKISAGLARATGCRVLSLDYRMAPEHAFPAAVEDGVAAYRWLLDEGFDPARVAISGDSAGGGLTIATLVAARDQGLSQPGAAVVFSPWTDLEGTGASMDAMAALDLMIDRTAISGVAAMYLQGADVRSPLASPMYADLTGLAPLYIQVGGHETLLDDSTRLAVNAAHAGVDVRLDVFPEMQHVFQSAIGMLPESDDAFARVGSFVRARLAVS